MSPSLVEQFERLDYFGRTACLTQWASVCRSGVVACIWSRAVNLTREAYFSRMRRTRLSLSNGALESLLDSIGPRDVRELG
jgi:hypothetical protein